MSKDSWEVTQAHMDNARVGTMMMAEMFGLDVKDEKIKKFLEHEVKIIAHLQAQCDFYSFHCAPKNLQTWGLYYDKVIFKIRG